MPTMRPAVRGRTAAKVVAAVAALLVGVSISSPALAAGAGRSPAVPMQEGGPLVAPVAAPSDPRATFVEGNAVSCTDVGYPDDI